MSNFSDLAGKTIIAIDGATKGSECIVITCADLSRFVLRHSQDCCESVQVEDVAGEPSDLVGHVVSLAEEASNSDNPPPHTDSWTWTFYRLRTHGGDLTIRWLGESNGYYGETAQLDVMAVDISDLTPKQQVLRDVALERGG